MLSSCRMGPPRRPFHPLPPAVPPRFHECRGTDPHATGRHSEALECLRCASRPPSACGAALEAEVDWGARPAELQTPAGGQKQPRGLCERREAKGGMLHGWRQTSSSSSLLSASATSCNPKNSRAVEQRPRLAFDLEEAQRGVRLGFQKRGGHSGGRRQLQIVHAPQERHQRRHRQAQGVEVGVRPVLEQETQQLQVAAGGRRMHHRVPRDLLGRRLAARVAPKSPVLGEQRHRRLERLGAGALRASNQLLAALLSRGRARRRLAAQLRAAATAALSPMLALGRHAFERLEALHTGAALLLLGRCRRDLACSFGHKGRGGRLRVSRGAQAGILPPIGVAHDGTDPLARGSRLRRRKRRGTLLRVERGNRSGRCQRTAQLRPKISKGRGTTNGGDGSYEAGEKSHQRQRFSKVGVTTFHQNLINCRWQLGEAVR
eukprot:scaffold257_cov241-Pinguiococcus_pyrenoidosus.AAC.3